MAINNLLYRNRFVPYGVYLLVTLAVMLPLLRPGFILTLDMVFTPHLRMPQVVTSSYAFHVVLAVLNTVIPADMLEKILLTGVLFGSCVGMHRLVRKLRGTTTYSAGLFVASVFYALNPFTYARFMAGQYAVLLGYAVLPWLIASAIRLCHAPTIRQAVIMGIWTTVLGVVSVHMLTVVLLLAVCSCVVLALTRRYPHRAVVGRMTLVAAGTAVVLSSYWLLPVALGHGTMAHTINSFSDADTAAFASIGSGWIGRVANIIRLQGFWADGRALYLLPQDVTMLWGLLMLGIIVLALIGLRLLWKTHRLIHIVLIASTLLAIVVAAGGATALFNHLPLGGALREPHKLVALLALTYSVGLAYGVDGCIRWLRRSARHWAAIGSVGLLLLPFAAMRVFLWGGNGQLHSVHYPADWQTVNTLLQHDNTAYTAIFLPWHQYLSFGFTGRIIANPAEQYFDKPVITSADPEFKSAVSGKQDGRRTAIAHSISQPGSSTAQQLGRLDIKYLLVSKDADDAQSATAITRAAHMTRIYDSPTLALYKNEMWRTAP